MTTIVQLCQVRRNRVKCGRRAVRWVRLEYPGWAGVPSSVVWAACEGCRQDPRIVEDLGPIEVVKKAAVGG
jgi:hypothetical protein